MKTGLDIPITFLASGTSVFLAISVFILRRPGYQLICAVKRYNQTKKQAYNQDQRFTVQTLVNPSAQQYPAQNGETDKPANADELQSD
jgi:hypothetical protein